MKTIYVIRHAESIANAERRAGRATDPLTERGRNQARQLAARFTSIPLEAVLSSTYTRAQETAQIVADALGLPLETSDLFVESKSPSSVEGLSSQDPRLKEVRALLHDNWGNPTFHHSDEENFFGLSTRARAALQFLEDHPANCLAVVSHGAFICALAEVLVLGDDLTAPLSTRFYNAFPSSNTGVMVVELDGPRRHIVRWNDTIHLEPQTLEI